MTIKEYFLKALEEGYHWSQSALNNLTDPDMEVTSLDEAIAWGFIWDETPEGSDYWFNVWNDVKTYLRMAKYHNSI